ncbi:serine/threonine-protein phosphatase CPPED1 [Oncorhynchus nerka]|uniref:serine/threonine-protein phosphatase CPPED1 n=1 Tax=Oncorhynchus nerka TaxID=8023 RepID=UPI0031B80045
MTITVTSVLFSTPGPGPTGRAEGMERSILLHPLQTSSWAEEVQLTHQAVEAVNKLCRRPKFMVLCGDMVRARPPFREGQERDLKVALRGTDPSIPLVFVSENHDLRNTPTPETVAQFCNAWGDDYFSFLVGGLTCTVIPTQLFFGVSACPDRRDVQEAWLEGQLQKASQGLGITPKQAFHFSFCKDSSLETRSKYRE